MRRLIISLVLATSLLATACTPPQSAGQVVVTARSTIDKVADAFESAKATAQIALLFLSPARAAQVQAAIAEGDKAIAAARAAVTLAEQIAQLDQAKAATATLDKASTL